MMTRNTRIWRGLIIVGLLVSVGLAGCWRDEPDSLTGPEGVEQPVTAAGVSNFYARGGVTELGDEFGVYAQPGEFVVQLPPGDYLIAYQTQSGMYAAVARAAKTSLIYIGLNSGEEVINALVFTGTISTIPDDAWVSGDVILCSWPKSSTPSWKIFESPAFQPLFETVLANPAYPKLREYFIKLVQRQ